MKIYQPITNVYANNKGEIYEHETLRSAFYRIHRIHIAEHFGDGYHAYRIEYEDNGKWLNADCNLYDHNTTALSALVDEYLIDPLMPIKGIYYPHSHDYREAPKRVQSRIRAIARQGAKQ